MSGGIGRMLLSFSSFFGSFFDAFFYGFYFTIRSFFIFMNWEYGIPGYYWVFLITQLIVVGITLNTAKSKGYSLFLTFLLCLAFPLLGSMVIFSLLPDKYEMSLNRTGSSYRGNSSGINLSEVAPITTKVNSGETWVCKKCEEKNPIASSTCKSCGAYK